MTKIIDYKVNRELFDDALFQANYLQTDDYNLTVVLCEDDANDPMIPWGVAYEVMCGYKFSDANRQSIYLDENYKILNPDESDINILIEVGLATAA